MLAAASPATSAAPVWAISPGGTRGDAGCRCLGVVTGTLEAGGRTGVVGGVVSGHVDGVVSGFPRTGGVESGVMTVVGSPGPVDPVVEESPGHSSPGVVGG